MQLIFTPIILRDGRAAQSKAQPPWRSRFALAPCGQGRADAALAVTRHPYHPE